MNTIQKLRKNRNTFANRMTAINDEMIVNAEALIKESVKTGHKWQKLTVKSIDKTQPLVERQIDIVFDSLTALKNQMFAGQERFKTLVGSDAAVAKATMAARTVRAKVAKASPVKVVKAATKKTVSAAKNVTKEAPVKAAKKVATKIVKPAVKASTKATTVKAEKLSVIKGIGPKLEGILAENGIKSFNDLANVKIESLQKILDGAGSIYKTSKPNEWIIAAQNLLK